MKRVNYYLTDNQYEGIKTLSEESELSVSELIRRAVDLYLAQAKRASKKKGEKDT